MAAQEGKPKVSSAQYEIMLKFMEGNPRLLSKSFDEHFNKYDKEERWSTLIEHLNSEDPKNKRRVEEWRKVWSNWKYLVKQKEKKYKERGLSPLEQRLFRLLKANSENNITSTPKEASVHGISSSTARDSEASVIFNPDQSTDSEAEENVDSSTGSISNSTYPEDIDRTRSGWSWDEESCCKIVEEMRRWRELDQMRIEILQEMMDQQAEMQASLSEIGGTLRKILAVQEKLPDVLGHIKSSLTRYK